MSIITVPCCVCLAHGTRIYCVSKCYTLGVGGRRGNPARGQIWGWKVLFSNIWQRFCHICKAAFHICPSNHLQQKTQSSSSETRGRGFSQKCRIIYWAYVCLQRVQLYSFGLLLVIWTSGWLRPHWMIYLKNIINNTILRLKYINRNCYWFLWVLKIPWNI